MKNSLPISDGFNETFPTQNYQKDTIFKRLNESFYIKRCGFKIYFEGSVWQKHCYTKKYARKKETLLEQTNITQFHNKLCHNCPFYACFFFTWVFICVSHPCCHPFVLDLEPCWTSYTRSIKANCETRVQTAVQKYGRCKRLSISILSYNACGVQILTHAYYCTCIHCAWIWCKNELLLLETVL